MRSVVWGIAALGVPIAGTAQTTATDLKPVTVASGLRFPWSLAFLPDGRMLVTERPGRIRIVAADGRLGAPLGGVPEVVTGGQSGLFEVVLDPQFGANRTVYISYMEADRSGASGLAVARAQLGTDALTDLRVVFRQLPKLDGRANLGGKLVFGRDGKLYVSLGDRFGRRDDAQSLADHIGKIARIESDGRVPADNPFVGRPGAAPEIWSYGHRNAQGLAIQPSTGELWEDEHGPQGGDELNVIERGRNYGWPVVTYGAEYGTGAKIGIGTAQAGMEQPLTWWVPSIATSGLAFTTTGDRYPGWKGNAFVGALRAQALVRLELDGHRVVRQERLLQELHERIRDVREGPDGWLYVLTDSAEGRIIRLERR